MKKAALLGSTWAAGAAITAFGFGLAPSRQTESVPALEISLENSIGYAESLANEAANNIANAERVRAMIETAFAEAKQMQQDAQRLLADASQMNNATQESIAQQKAQILYGNILYANAEMKKQEAQAIERYMNDVRYDSKPASYEEARFNASKARILATLASLDASGLSAEDQAVFQAYREVITPQIEAATMDSPLGVKIDDIEIPTRLSSIVCSLLKMNVAAKAICTLAVDQIEDALGGEVIDKTVEQYKEKFKNLSPLDALDCLKQALDQSVDANLRDLINLNPNHISPNSLTGFESFFKDPHKEMDFSGPFNRALDQCIETRNNQIEHERQERERQKKERRERESRERQINDRYREPADSSPSDGTSENRSRDRSRDNGGGRDSGGSGSGGGCERNSGPKENFCDGLRDLGIDRDCGGGDNSSGGDGGNDGGGDCGGGGDDGMGIALRLSQMRQYQHC